VHGRRKKKKEKTVVTFGIKVRYLVGSYKPIKVKGDLRVRNNR
jgi:hypothetical protein